jgi:hypothetical protein
MLPTPLQRTPKPIDPILNQGFVWPVLNFRGKGLEVNHITIIHSQFIHYIISLWVQQFCASLVLVSPWLWQGKRYLKQKNSDGIKMMKRTLVQ